MSVKKQAIKLIHRQLAQPDVIKNQWSMHSRDRGRWGEEREREETINAKYKRAKSFGFFAQQNERHGKEKQTNRKIERERVKD